MRSTTAAEQPTSGTDSSTSETDSAKRDPFQSAFLSQATKRIRWNASEKAMKKLCKQEPDFAEVGYYWINSLMKVVALERLHAPCIESPFFEHKLAIVSAGFEPAGISGNNWRTCQFLYY